MKFAQTGDREYTENNFNRAENWLRNSGFTPQSEPESVLEATPDGLLWAVCVIYAQHKCTPGKSVDIKSKLRSEVTEDPLIPAFITDSGFDPSQSWGSP